MGQVLHGCTATTEAVRMDHRQTKPKHPWTNGGVERMNGAIEDASVKLALRKPQRVHEAPWRRRCHL